MQEEEKEQLQPFFFLLCLDCTEILLVFWNAEVCYITLRCTLHKFKGLKFTVCVLGSLLPALVKD